MPVPQIVHVYPSAGTPTGGQLVQVMGFGFRVPDPPGDELRTEALAPTVEVEVDGVASPRVMVASASRLFFETPKIALGSQASLAAGLTIRNLDDEGAPIPGEEVTAAAAFEVRRPATDASATSGLQHLTRTLIRLLKSEVHPNVSNLTPHVDWDDDPDADAVKYVGEVPGITVAGPRLARDPTMTMHSEPSTDPVLGTGVVQRWTPPEVYAASYDVAIFDELHARLLNLTEILTGFVEHNRTIEVAVDPADPSAGTYEVECDFTTAPEVDPESGDVRSNLRMAKAVIVLRGLPIRNFAGEVGHGSTRVEFAATDGVLLKTTGTLGEDPT